jgi:cytochrome c553
VRCTQIGRWALLTALSFWALPALAQQPQTQACAGCHGADGNSTMAGVPSIAAQPKVFLENYLVLTREGLRGSDVMQKLLHGMRDAEIVALASHYARLPAKAQAGAPDKARFERGRSVAAKIRCASCHEADYRGREQMPRLAAQREDFLLARMRDYRANRVRGGDTIMAASLYGIPDEDFTALAHYFARLR